MAARAALLLEVLLVVVLGLVERLGRDDLGRHRLGELRLDARLGRDRRLLLLGRVEVDRRAVLAADVRPLPVPLRGVVRAPEEVEQLVVGDLLGVVLDLDRLGVAGRVGADVVVGGVVGVPAGVADAGAGDAGDLPERRLDAPEAARLRMWLSLSWLNSLADRRRCYAARSPTWQLAAAALLEVLLVVLLGLPERRGRLDLRDDLRAASAARPGARPSTRGQPASCSGEWKKIAERYCEPMSKPCRLRERGLCLRQKASSSSS